jgi:hypothetical protein
MLCASIYEFAPDYARIAAGIAGGEEQMSVELLATLGLIAFLLQQYEIRSLRKRIERLERKGMPVFGA